MLRLLHAAALILLIVVSTGVVDLDAVFGHVDDCADRCCGGPPGPSGSGGAQGHCSCCCVGSHVTDGPSATVPDGVGPLALLQVDGGAAPRSASATPVFHPPRA